MLSGQNYGSISSSNSGSANTSMDDWSDDSDEDIENTDSATEMQIAKEWLAAEFKTEAPLSEQ